MIALRLSHFSNLRFIRRGSITATRKFATKRQQRAAEVLSVSPSTAGRFSAGSQQLILPDTSQWESFQDSLSVHVDSSHPELFDPQVHMPSMPTDWRGYEEATPLWENIVALIGVSGKPISVAEYMRMCLMHPEHGYYTHATSERPKDVDFDRDDYLDEAEESKDSIIIGPGGDFITAPEISQIFGECIGVWFMTQWQRQGSPSSFQLVECGPGKGSLMIDLLRFAFHPSIVDSFGSACKQVHLVESSPVLRERQRDALEQDLRGIVGLKFPDSDDSLTSKVPTVEVCWHDSLADLQMWQAKRSSTLPTFAVCQEFLDALPVYVFEKTSEGWRERLVDIALREDLMEESERKQLEATLDDKLRLRVVLAPEVTPSLATLLRVGKTTGLRPKEVMEEWVGQVVEVNPEGILLCRDLAGIVDRQGGGALVIDYGEEGSTDSIRAFAKHEQVSFLSRPGRVDVTADVDFAAMRFGVNSLELDTKAYGPIGQGSFLMALGAEDRVLQLIQSDSTTDEQAEDLYNALVRLASPEEMGERFKVLAIAKGGDEAPAGF